MTIAKARLIEIESLSPNAPSNTVPGTEIVLDFNPESLKVSLANNNKGGSQPAGGSGKQFLGNGTSSLSVEFVVDSTADSSDVRRKTQKMARFVAAKEDARTEEERRKPPRVRFEWGSFIFEGVVDSLDETLDYFGANGVPMRATVSLKLSRDAIVFLPEQTVAKEEGAAGQIPLTGTIPGESVHEAAAKAGVGRAWKAIAAANRIDDPLRLQAGAKLDMRAGFAAQAAGFAGGAAGAALGAGAGASASFGAGAAAGGRAGASAAAAASARAGFSAGLGGGIGFSAGARGAAGAGASVGAGVGASAGFGVSAGASVGGVASAGIGATAGAGFGSAASAGFGAGAGGGAGFEGGAGAQASFGVGAGAGLQAGTGVNAGIGAAVSTSTTVKF
jgi:hypothetical protein